MCALASPLPLASTRLLPFLSGELPTLSPSALCHELRVQKLRRALFLELLAFDPSYCPPFFVGFIPRSGALPALFPWATFCCVQGPLLCQDQVLPTSVGAAALGILCACAVPAQQVKQQNGVSSTSTVTSFQWEWGEKSANIRVCKTVLKKKEVRISARASHHLLVA